MINKVIMCPPDFYRVEYAINSYMKDENGNLNKVNTELSKEQWKNLKSVYERIGLEVWQVKPHKDLPDMVYTANQSLQISKNDIVLSKMASNERAPEVDVFKSFYEEKGFNVHIFDFDKFEGMGDAIWHPGKNILWAGYGFRSSLESYEKFCSEFNIAYTPLKLINEDFYHLDTCFFVIDTDTACYVEEAFDEEGIKSLKEGFKNLIKIEYDEAIKHFAANAFCPDGKNIVIQKGSVILISKLKEMGYTVHEVETSEFIKGGGSCFCLKMALY